MTKKEKEKYKIYYDKVLLQFLGLEKDIYLGKNGSLIFYHYPIGKMILWCGANKIQQTKNATWIYDADKFIISKILKEKKVPTYIQFYNGTQIKIQY